MTDTRTPQEIIRDYESPFSHHQPGDRIVTRDGVECVVVPVEPTYEAETMMRSYPHSYIHGPVGFYRELIETAAKG